MTKEQRNEAIASAFEVELLTAAQLAERFSMSMRSVHRILAERMKARR